MALVKLPEGQQRSGAQGGMVWSHNRTGPYTRERGVPVNPNTDRQVAVRNAVRFLAIAWQTILDQAKRDAWDHYAANVVWKDALGRSIFLTGLNHYVRSNTPLLISALPRIDDAPTIFNIAAAEQALAVTASETTQQLSVSWDETAVWVDETGAHQFVYMGIPVNSSRKFFGGPWRLVGVIDGDETTPPTAPQVMDVAWPIAEGQRIWVRTRIIRADGRLSEFAQLNFLAGNGASADAR